MPGKQPTENHDGESALDCPLDNPITNIFLNLPPQKFVSTTKQESKTK